MIVWSLASDQDDDFINDLWETNAAPGYLLGFRIDPDTVSTNNFWRGNWDHGWATSATITNRYNNPYPDGYSADDGYGLCPRNEYDVTNSATADSIRQKDWSLKGP